VVTGFTFMSAEHRPTTEEMNYGYAEDGFRDELVKRELRKSSAADEQRICAI